MKGDVDSPGISDYAGVALGGIIRRVLDEKGVEVNTGEEEGADIETKAALAEIQGRFESLVIDMPSLVQEIAQRADGGPLARFEVQEAVTKLTPRKPPDAVLVVYGNGWIGTKWKHFTDSLAPVPNLGDTIFLHLGLIDRKTGALAFYDWIWIDPKFLQDSEVMAKPIKKSLDNFFSEAPAGKPARSRPK